MLMIFSRLPVIVFPVGLALLLAACASPPRYANVRYEANDSVAETRAHIKTFSATTCIDNTRKVSDGCSVKKEETFIGVAISGGGSRAANFAAGVLRELDYIGILRNVDAISSVSGGSLASAYVAAKGKKYQRNTFEFWENAKRDLSQDFRSKLLVKLARPDNFFASMFGTLGRTELMAEVFDDSLFKGLTFGDMGDDGFGLLINATALNELPNSEPQMCATRGTWGSKVKWESVAFTDRFFRSCLSSDLNSYPLSRAVAASAAFPGLFSAVPLASYYSDSEVHFGAPKTPKHFLHVMDGGASDNLGIESLAGSLLFREERTKTKIKQCLFIVIDAFASGDIDQRHNTDDVRSWSDRLVDSNFLDSIDAMLSHRRETALSNLGQLRQKYSKNTTYSEFRTAHDFPVPDADLELIDFSRTSKTSLRKVMGLQPKVHFNEDLNCSVWYLSIDGLEEFVVANWEYGSSQRIDDKIRELKSHHTPAELEKLADLPEYNPQTLLNTYLKTQYPRHVMAVRDLATRVKTDFDLVGPKNCSSSVLASALWSAGMISVNADVRSRAVVCKWIQATGQSVADFCDSERLHEVPKLPVKYVPLGSGDYSVTCQ